MKSESQEIGSLNYRIVLKFDRGFGNIVAEEPVKGQRDGAIPNTNLMSSSQEVDKIFLLEIEMGNWLSVHTIV